MSTGVGIFAEYGVGKPAGDQGGFWQQSQRGSVSSGGDLVSGLRLCGLGAGLHGQPSRLSKWKHLPLVLLIPSPVQKSKSQRPEPWMLIYPSS